MKDIEVTEEEVERMGSLDAGKGWDQHVENEKAGHEKASH